MIERASLTVKTLIIDSQVILDEIVFLKNTIKTYLVPKKLVIQVCVTDWILCQFFTLNANCFYKFYWNIQWSLGTLRRFDGLYTRCKAPARCRAAIRCRTDTRCRFFTRCRACTRCRVYTRCLLFILVSTVTLKLCALWSLEFLNRVTLIPYNFVTLHFE